MAKYPIVLTIAGSDSSGGAGIQADIKTMSAIGVYAASTVTAVTAQNTLGVDGVQGIDPDMVARQIDAVFSDLRPDAVKIGMLYSRSIVEAVADRFCHWRPQNVVLDPVMISTSGSRLIEEDAVEAIKEKLFPFASLLTPNLMEAEHLTGIAIDGIAPAREAARCIVEKGCRAALVKGGHLDGDVAATCCLPTGSSANTAAGASCRSTLTARDAPCRRLSLLSSRWDYRWPRPWAAPKTICTARSSPVPVSLWAADTVR